MALYNIQQTTLVANGAGTHSTSHDAGTNPKWMVIGVAGGANDYSTPSALTYGGVSLLGPYESVRYGWIGGYGDVRSMYYYKVNSGIPGGSNSLSVTWGATAPTTGRVHIWTGRAYGTVARASTDQSSGLNTTSGRLDLDAGSLTGNIFYAGGSSSGSVGAADYNLTDGDYAFNVDSNSNGGFGSEPAADAASGARVGGWTGGIVTAGNISGLMLTDSKDAPPLAEPAGPGSGYHSVVKASSPDSYWRLHQASGAFLDEIGGIDLTANGTIGREEVGNFTWESSLQNNAGIVVSDAATGWGDGGDVYDFDTNKSFSVMAWVRPDVDQTTDAYVVQKFESGVGGWALGVNTTQEAYFKVTDGTTVDQADDMHIPAWDGRWYCIVGVYDFDRKMAGVYVNGWMSDNAYFNKPIIANTTETLKVGADVAADNFEGAIDEVAVWSRALTQREVWELWYYGSSEGRARQREVYRDLMTAHFPMHYYRLNEPYQVGGLNGAIYGEMGQDQGVPWWYGGTAWEDWGAQWTPELLPEPENLIINGTFESTLNGWTESDPTSSSWVGGYLEIIGDGTGEEEVTNDARWETGVQSAYEYSGRALQVAGTFGANIEVVRYDDTGAEVSSQGTSTGNPANKWTDFRGESDPDDVGPPAEATLRVHIPSASTDTFRYDDLVVRSVKGSYRKGLEGPTSDPDAGAIQLNKGYLFIPDDPVFQNSTVTVYTLTTLNQSVSLTPETAQMTDATAGSLIITASVISGTTHGITAVSFGGKPLTLHTNEANTTNGHICQWHLDDISGRDNDNLVFTVPASSGYSFTAFLMDVPTDINDSDTQQGLYESADNGVLMNPGQYDGYAVHGGVIEGDKALATLVELTGQTNLGGAYDSGNGSWKHSYEFRTFAFQEQGYNINTTGAESAVAAVIAVPKSTGPGVYEHDDESNQASIRVRENPYLETDDEYIAENWPWTIVLWVKMNEVPPSNVTTKSIVYSSSVYTNDGIELWWYHSTDASPRLSFERLASSSSGNIITTTALPTYDEWHMLAWTWDGENNAAYIDGRLAGNDYGTDTRTRISTPDDMWLGAHDSTDLNGAPMTVSEWGQFRKALTAEDISTLYSASQSGGYPTAQALRGVAMSMSPYNYWRLIERSGTEAQDEMQNIPDALYDGAYEQAFDAAFIRGSFQPIPQFREATDAGRLTVADTPKHDFFDSNGDYSVAFFVRPRTQFIDGPVDMNSATGSDYGFVNPASNGPSVWKVPFTDFETPKARIGDLWFIHGAHTNPAAEDVGDWLVNNAGFTNLWNSDQTNYRTFGVYKFITAADLTHEGYEYLFDTSETSYGRGTVFRGARSIEAATNAAGSNPPSLNPSWATADNAYWRWAATGWDGTGPPNAYTSSTYDRRDDSNTYDPADINIGSDTNGHSWTIAVRGMGADGTDGADAYLFSRDNGTSGHRIILDRDDGELRFERRNGGGTDSVIANNLSFERWHLIVGTYDGVADEMTLYVDGVPATVKSGSGSANPQTSTRDVGTLTTTTDFGGTSTGNGLLAEWSDLLIWNSEVTAAQVRELWDAALNGMNSRGSLMLRWTTGRRNGFTLPFNLGVVDFGYVLPFDLEGLDEGRGTTLEFILDGDAAAAPNGYRTRSLSLAPIGHWTLEEAQDTYDDSIGDLHMSPVGLGSRNGLPFTGAIRAPQFDGSSYMTAYDNAAYDFAGTAAFSVAGWYYNDGSGADGWFANKYVSSTGWYFGVDSSEALIAAREANTLVSTTAMTTATWSHVALTFDGTDLKLWLDGIEVATEDQSATTVTANVAVLGISDATTSGLTGRLQDLAIWNVALTQSDVEALAAATTNHPIDATGYELPFLLDGPAEKQYELPFNLLDATTGADSAGVFSPLVGWYDPIPVIAADYTKTLQSMDGLLASWRLNETQGSTFGDTLGGPDLGVSGTPTLGSPAGPIATDNQFGVTFDATGDALRYTDTTFGDYLHPGDTLSLVVWFKRTTTGALQELYCAGLNGLEVGIDASNQPFAAENGVGNFFTTTTTTTDTTKWHMLVVTKAGATRAMYLDNVALTNSAGDQTLTDSGGDIYIGRHQQSATNEYVVGAVAEVALLDRAITATEVDTLWRLARGG